MCTGRMSQLNSVLAYCQVSLFTHKSDFSKGRLSHIHRQTQDFENGKCRSSDWSCSGGCISSPTLFPLSQAGRPCTKTAEGDFKSLNWVRISSPCLAAPLHLGLWVQEGETYKPATTAIPALPALLQPELL